MAILDITKNFLRATFPTSVAKNLLAVLDGAFNLVEATFLSLTSTTVNVTGALKLSGVTVPTKVAMSYSTGGTNVATVTFVEQDEAGNPVTGVHTLLVWLSDSASGHGLTTTSASGTVTAGEEGYDLVDLVDKKCLIVTTSGVAGIGYELDITDSAKTGFYPACSLLGSGVIIVGDQLVSGDYG